MIDELFDRNVGWATGKTRIDPDYFRRLAEQQLPRYLWLGCSDSDGLLRDLGLKLSSLDDAESLDREDDFAGLTEPITMVRRHAEEAFAGLSMLESQLLEEG